MRAAEVTRRQEPLTVTALRTYIRAGASPAVLFRIAGGEAEFHRLATDYQLRPLRATPAAFSETKPNTPTTAPAARPPLENSDGGPALTSRQSLLLQLVEQKSRDGEVWPPPLELAALLECSWLVVERDLGRLVRKGRIRVGHVTCNGRPVRRIELVGKGFATALPPPNRVGAMKTESVGNE